MRLGDRQVHVEVDRACCGVKDREPLASHVLDRRESTPDDEAVACDPISQTWPFAFALNFVTRWPLAVFNLTSFLMWCPR